MKKFKIYLGSLLIVLLLMSLLISSCVKRDYNEVFKNNWKVELPENMEEQFRKSEDNFGFYGIRYAVFKLEEEPTIFLEDFNIEKDESIEDKVTATLNKANFKIPEEYLPTWAEIYYWKVLEKETNYNDGEVVIDRCYLLYFTNLKELAICQDFP